MTQSYQYWLHKELWRTEGEFFVLKLLHLHSFPNPSLTARNLRKKKKCLESFIVSLGLCSRCTSSFRNTCHIKKAVQNYGYDILIGNDMLTTNGINHKMISLPPLYLSIASSFCGLANNQLEWMRCFQFFFLFHLHFFRNVWSW